MATLGQLATIAQDSGFRDRVKVAILVKARSVYGDGVKPDTVAPRVWNFGLQIIGDPNVMATQVAWTIVTDPAMPTTVSSPASVTDQMINDIVNNNWNALAGYAAQGGVGV